LASSDTTTPNYEQQDPDVRLMLRVRDGNAAAFEELVARYQDRLLTVLEHLVPRRELAEDLTQDVFLRVFRARKTYVAGAKFSTWLFTIANRVASNALRDLSRRREITLGQQESGEQPVLPLERLAVAQSSLMPTRQADKAERAEVVHQAMQELNERQRMALLLSKFENMSYADMGTAMGMSTQAVKSLLSRARSNLRALLEPYIEEGTWQAADTPTSSEQPAIES
jgi:RNA polymerase sigma-70 factor (ECF subfamily)